MQSNGVRFEYDEYEGRQEFISAGRSTGGVFQQREYTTTAPHNAFQFLLWRRKWIHRNQIWKMEMVEESAYLIGVKLCKTNH